MSKFYSEEHLALQERFDSRRMADFMEQGIVHSAFAPEEAAFIESRDMFFLSTVDNNGRPTVSYKGGAAGFVKVTGPSSFAFPSYDGNGMFYSAGNIAASRRVGLLFIDFETPHRLRVQGQAEIGFDHPLQADYPEAQFMVSVVVEEIWVNCPRYVHKRLKAGNSKYVPEAGKQTPVPTWKRIDIVQPALPVKDKGKAEAAGGVITQEVYADLLSKGEA